jgi:hypothetical protein
MPRGFATAKALIVQAAAQAQKAADFIMGTKFEDAVAGILPSRV